MNDLPGAGGRADAVPAARARAAHLGHALELRPRPRLPLPVLASAPSSTCRAARAASARPTISSRSCARTTRRASSASSSPTTISRATRNWEPLFDRLIELRSGEGLNIGFTIQVDTLCHQIPNFIEKAARGRRAARVHRAREHQPRQPDRRQEAPEQDHRIPRDAAEVAQPRRHHLRRLHHRLPGRHQGIDPARHRDHQARAAARHSRVLLPDAAAGLRGPQEVLLAARASGWTPT